MRLGTKLCVTLLMLVLPGLLLAQTGSIAGLVTDPTGAVVSGASVTATNQATGAISKFETSGSGNYTVTNLPVGIYTLTFEKAGFKILKFDNVNVTVALVLPLDAQFEVGSAQETVSVSVENSAPVETESSQVSNLVDDTRMKALPLITRNPYELVLLSPGTAQSTGSGGFVVNGSRDRNNNFLLDGVDNNDTSVPGIAGGVLAASPENSEEFRIVTDNFNAEYGRNTGAIIDVVTKSGGNSFHGNAYWFGRYNKIGGARDWFNPESGGPANPYVRNQFGYSIGGPIWKNKTFFFFNQEFQRFPTANTVSAVVPTQGFVNGVFNWQGVDSATGAPVTEAIDLTPGSQQNQAYIQNGQFGAYASVPPDPTTQKIFSKFPAPQVLNADGFSGLTFFPDSSNFRGYQATAKIDHHFTENETVSVRYGYDPGKDPSPFGDATLPNNVGATSFSGISQGVAANLTSTLRPTMVNSFSFGWNQIIADFACTGLNVLNSVYPVDPFGHGAEFVMNPFSSFACANDTLLSDGQGRKTNTISYGDNLTWVRGPHTWKFGGEYRDVHEQGSSNFGQRRQIDTRAGTLGVPDLIGLNLPASVDTTALDDAISAWFGLSVGDNQSQFFDKSGTRKGDDNKFYIQHEYGIYAQDTWKLRRNLTLNIGLRYQFYGVPYEKDGNQSNLYTDPRSFPVVFQLGRQLFDNDYTNFEPRLGFSWDPKSDGKMAIRGGFGIFHDRIFGNLFGNARGNPPLQGTYNAVLFQTINNSFPGQGNAVFPLQAPTQPFTSSIPDGALAGPTIFPSHFPSSTLNSWFFGIQRELPGQTVLDLSYVGNNGVHIFRVVDANPPDPSRVAAIIAACAVPGNIYGCTPDDVQGPILYSGGDIGFFPENAVAHNAIGRGTFAAALNEAEGTANYNSLQLKVTKRMSHGLQLQGAYTWSHSIDNSNDPIVPGLGGVSFARNPLNPDQDHGNSDHDIRQVAVLNYIWDMPFGHGKSFANSGIVGKVLEGFELSGIVTLQSGRAFDIFATIDSQRVGRVGRPDLVGNPFAGNLVIPGSKVFFTNPNVFINPPFGRAGDVERNTFHGPAFANADVTLAKQTKIGERVTLETRLEVYNLLNHPNFAPPGTFSVENTIGSSLFGTMNSQIGRPDGTTGARQLQMAAKFIF
jgi:Carboxypeptidase regulatory-like domain/TonB dependent receptor